MLLYVDDISFNFNFTWVAMWTILRVVANTLLCMGLDCVMLDKLLVLRIMCVCWSFFQLGPGTIVFGLGA